MPVLVVVDCVSTTMGMSSGRRPQVFPCLVAASNAALMFLACVLPMAANWSSVYQVA